MKFDRANKTTRWHRVLTGIIILTVTTIVLPSSVTRRAHSAFHRSNTLPGIQERGNIQRGIWEIIHFIPADSPKSLELIKLLAKRKPNPYVNESIYWMDHVPAADQGLRQLGYHTSIFHQSSLFPGISSSKHSLVIVANPSGTITYTGQHQSGPRWMQSRFLNKTIFELAVNPNHMDETFPSPRNKNTTP